jgi:hypothetical protein
MIIITDLHDKLQLTVIFVPAAGFQQVLTDSPVCQVIL